MLFWNVFPYRMARFRLVCRAALFLPIAVSVPSCAKRDSIGPADKPCPPLVEYYRMKTPDGLEDIDQASGLHYGSLGTREGLWLVCDRNSVAGGNRIFFFDRRQLATPRHDQNIAASGAFNIVGPPKGWDDFMAKHSTIEPAILAELRRQFENGRARRKPILDLEAITVGQPNAPFVSGKKTPARLYAVAEQPHSLVLELQLVENAGKTEAVLTDCFLYSEKSSEAGSDANDGLEAIAWAGQPGLFFIAEEGTRPYRANDDMHFFDCPRLMRCRLKNAQVIVDEPWSERATSNVRAFQDNSTHTLNALARLDDRTLAAVDRNGGYILKIDIPTASAKRWLNLYESKGLNLRKKLAHFPATRRMPYVSIEGLALDPQGNLWLIDDPAMPEAFRASALIRAREP